MKPVRTFLSVLLASALLPWGASADENEAPPAKPPRSSSASPQERERFMSLSEGAKEKLREKMAESREKLSNASSEERRAYFDKVFAKIEADDKEGKFRAPANAERQEKPSTVADRGESAPARKRDNPPQLPTDSKLLPQNYRVSISGNEADKPLGNLTGLTCTSAISLEGTLDKADPPTLINVSGNFEDKDGSITFTYSIGFNVPVVAASLSSGSRDGGKGTVTTTISYKTQICKGALHMTAGKSYEVLKAGGITYSVSITPEPDK